MNIREIVRPGVCKHMDTSKTIHVETEEEKVIRVVGSAVRWAVLAVSVSLFIFFLTKALAAGFFGAVFYGFFSGWFGRIAYKAAKTIYGKVKENKNVIFA